MGKFWSPIADRRASPGSMPARSRPRSIFNTGAAAERCGHRQAPRSRDRRLHRRRERGADPASVPSQRWPTRETRPARPAALVRDRRRGGAAVSLHPRAFDDPGREPAGPAPRWRNGRFLQAARTASTSITRADASTPHAMPAISSRSTTVPARSPMSGPSPARRM